MLMVLQKARNTPIAQKGMGTARKEWNKKIKEYTMDNKRHTIRSHIEFETPKTQFCEGAEESRFMK
jgi:hypothetical protein